MFKTSESITNISKALLVFDAEVSKINKTETNPFFKNKYASLSDIQDGIREPLIKSNLTVKQFPVSENGLVTIIIHSESGEYIQSEYIMKPTKDDPQQQGSRLTYQRRYALGACLGLNIDIDDDGNKASKPVTPQAQLKPVTVQKAPISFEAYEKALKCDDTVVLGKCLNAYVLTEAQHKAIEDRIINLKTK